MNYYKTIIDFQTGQETKVPLTQQEIEENQNKGQNREWENLRTERNSLLRETDWWVLTDRTPTDEQLAYRQALRDLPENTTDPTNPVWPTKPA